MRVRHLSQLTGAAIASLFLASIGVGASAEPSDAIPPRDEPLTVEAALEDIALARRALSSLHAGYDRYTSSDTLDAQWEATIRQAEAGMTRGELYLEMSRLLAMIRCDHTKAEIPDDFETYRDEVALYLPFRFKLFDGRMYVTVAGEGVPLAREDEIIAVDGEPVSGLLADLYPLFPVDGDTDFVKEPSVSDFGEFYGPAFEHFMPFLRPIEPMATVTVRRNTGGTERLSVQRLTFSDYSALTGEKRFSSNFRDAIRYAPLGDDAAYLAVDTFVNYRTPIEPDLIYQPIFQRMKAEGRTRLILDLRKNGGGSTDAQVGLVKWIAREPISQAEAVWTRAAVIDDDLKPYLRTWDQAALNPKPEWFEPLRNGYYKIIAPQAGAPGGPLAPKEGSFTGDLVLLTSTDNASGVTHLLAALRGADRGTFVGEPTGGAATGATAGILLTMTLPNSEIRVRIPLQRTIMANAEKFDPRLGIVPDILAPDTKESFFAGRDPALESARALLRIETP